MKKYSCLLLAVIAMSCTNETQTTQQKTLAKFEPANGQVILFAGQDLESIGGTDNYTDGYFDHFPAPGGFTQYTSFWRLPATRFNRAGRCNAGLEGMVYALFPHHRQ